MYLIDQHKRELAPATVNQGGPTQMCAHQQRGSPTYPRRAFTAHRHDQADRGIDVRTFRSVQASHAAVVDVGPVGVFVGGHLGIGSRAGCRSTAHFGRIITALEDLAHVDRELHEAARAAGDPILANSDQDRSRGETGRVSGILIR